SLVSRSALPTYADSTRAFVGRQRRGFRLLDLVPAVGEVLERVEGKTAGIEGNGSCSVLLPCVDRVLRFSVSLDGWAAQTSLECRHSNYFEPSGKAPDSL